MSSVSEVSTSSKEHEAPSLLRSRERAGQAQTPLLKLKLNEIFDIYTEFASWSGCKSSYEREFKPTKSFL